MPLSELPTHVLVGLFLAVFVLIGINPALQRTVTRLRKLLHSVTQQKNPFATRLKDVHAELFREHTTSRQLNDYEIIVLRRLAQASGKDLSLKQVNAPLLFGAEILHKTLRSLNRRGLIYVKLSTLFGQRFTLSDEGRRYAIEQGYMVQIRERKGAFG